MQHYSIQATYLVQIQDALIYQKLCVRSSLKLWIKRVVSGMQRAPNKCSEERGGKGNLGCTPHNLASQMLVEEKTHRFSAAAVVCLRFRCGDADFLGCLACDEYGAAVFEVLLHCREIDLFSFLNFDVLAYTVVKQQNLKQ